MAPQEYDLPGNHVRSYRRTFLSGGCWIRDGECTQMANVQQRNGSDSIPTYLQDANEEFFGKMGSVDSATIVKAVTGFVVLAIGVSFILMQIL